MKIRSAFFALAAWLLVAPEAGFAGTCALCRQALAIGGGDGLVKGVYLSILLIAGMPLLIFGMMVYFYYQGNKRTKQCSNEK